jgi:hypothetical protein
MILLLSSHMVTGKRRKVGCLGLSMGRRALSGPGSDSDDRTDTGLSHDTDKGRGRQNDAY